VAFFGSKVKLYSFYVVFFSSPSRSPVVDDEIVMMNTLYKERFPKVNIRLGHFGTLCQCRSLSPTC